MVKVFALIMRFVVIGIIYIVLFRIIKIMYMDLKGINKKDSPVMNFALEVLDAPSNIEIHRGNVFPVHSITNIGRKDDNHVIIDDKFVSGHHSRIFIKGENAYIKDLNSTNGTIRNGHKIQDVEMVETGDIIEIGRVSFKVIG